jgi:eukaryotic-like serine/threonine-protein kinase
MAAELIDDRYRLEERIAVGGMAEVWAAVDVELERRVALKLLLGAADPERFAREARAAAGLSHPAICQLYDYGDAGGRPYIVLEYLPGGTLEERLATGEPLADGDAARIAREVASGLAHAHERGLVHRDIKPGNVLFDEEGAAKITDFGIARILSESTLTEAGTLLGTATYISPEQARGERATPASDVYSFGVVLYRMLTGRLPFEAESPLELAAMHESADPPPISSLRSDAPPALERVATAALAKRPEERPQDGSDLLDALLGEPEAAVTAVLAPAGPADRLTAEPEGVSRRAPRALLFGGVLAALAAGGAAAALLTSNGDSEAPAKEPPPQTGSPGDGTRTTTERSDTTRETTRETQPTQTRSGATSTEPATTAPPEPTSAPTTTATPPVTPTVSSVPGVTTAPPEAPTTSPPVPTVTETSAPPEPPPPQ